VPAVLGLDRVSLAVLLEEVLDRPVGPVLELSVGGLRHVGQVAVLDHDELTLAEQRVEELQHREAGLEEVSAVLDHQPRPGQ
jgi:hypothetical protein